MHVPGANGGDGDEPPTGGKDLAGDRRVQPSAKAEVKKNKERNLGVEGGSEQCLAESSQFKATKTRGGAHTTEQIIIYYNDLLFNHSQGFDLR